MIGVGRCVSFEWNLREVSRQSEQQGGAKEPTTVEVVMAFQDGEDERSDLGQRSGTIVDQLGEGQSLEVIIKRG